MDFTTFSNIINGEHRKTATTRHNINPATEKPNAEVPVSTQDDVDEAIRGARAAFPGWAATSWQTRRTVVLGFADALEANKDQFCKLLKQEQGKPLHLADNELENAVRWLREIASLELPDEVIKESDTDKVVVKYKPLGIAVAIVPWNFPVMLACAKIASALITGNTLIVKPSPFTPYCGLKLAELAQQFSPPGVFQALSGDDNLGPWLTAHPGVDKISFTGSTATGRKVMESASRNLTRVTLELGGNDAAIVCADADIPSAAAALATFAFLNSGQICIAVKRLYVHESIFAEFHQAVVSFMKSLTISGADDAFMGPIQNHMQYERVSKMIDKIKESGYATVTSDADVARPGYFINPIIVENPPEDSQIVQEEPFGPVLPVLKWSTEDEVVKRANATNMGLGASVWSKDVDAAAKLAEKLEAGSVWVNSHLAIDPKVPFGGHKGSGIGSEGGTEGLKTFCNAQALFLKKASA